MTDFAEFTFDLFGLDMIAHCWGAWNEDGFAIKNAEFSYDCTVNKTKFIDGKMVFEKKVKTKWLECPAPYLDILQDYADKNGLIEMPDNRPDRIDND